MGIYHESENKDITQHSDHVKKRIEARATILLMSMGIFDLSRFAAEQNLSLEGLYIKYGADNVSTDRNININMLRAIPDASIANCQTSAELVELINNLYKE